MLGGDVTPCHARLCSSSHFNIQDPFVASLCDCVHCTLCRDSPCCQQYQDCITIGVQSLIWQFWEILFRTDGCECSLVFVSLCVGSSSDPLGWLGASECIRPLKYFQFYQILNFIWTVWLLTVWSWSMMAMGGAGWNRRDIQAEFNCHPDLFQARYHLDRDDIRDTKQRWKQKSFKIFDCNF